MKGRPIMNNKVAFNKRPSMKRVDTPQPPVIDKAFVSEMEIFYANDYPTYKRFEEWSKNFDRKKDRGTFDREKGVYALEKYLVPEIVRNYKKEYGETGYYRTPKEEKRAIAESIMKDYERIRKENKINSKVSKEEIRKALN